MGRSLHDTVMIVDDNEAALRLTTSLFQEEHYDVVPCADPLEAIHQIGVLDVDVVLTDIRMPRISGLQLLKRIHDIDPEMPVILMSGYPKLDMTIEAVKEAFDFVTKPYLPDEIIGSVRRAVAYRKKHFQRP